MATRKIGEIDGRHLAVVLPHIELEVSHTSGNYVIDVHGKRYLDFVMGWCVGNVGWNNEMLVKRLRDFSGPYYVSPDYKYAPWERLAKLLVDISPRNISVAFRATGGSEAIETALRAAMLYTGRTEFISIEGSYHGHTLGAMSIGSSEFRERFSTLMPGCHKLQLPLDDRCLVDAEQKLALGSIAAVVMEPVLCNLGGIIPTQEFMRGLHRLCKAHGTLLVVDEVATGFGRTGRLFAHEHYDIEPDIICLGKAITSGYAGMGATLVTEQIARAMDFEFSFYSTYGWHPVATEAAVANIEFIRDRWPELQSHVTSMGSYFESRLKEIGSGHIIDYRIIGLAIGLRFAAAGAATRLASLCRERGLLIHAMSHDTIQIFPALTITTDVADEGLSILAGAIRLL